MIKNISTLIDDKLIFSALAFEVGDYGIIIIVFRSSTIIYVYDLRNEFEFRYSYEIMGFVKP
jgi:hypothetical protein